jgi:hypothetical protein
MRSAVEETYNINEGILGDRLAAVDINKLEIKVDGNTGLAISDIGLSCVCISRSFFLECERPQNGRNGRSCT